MGMGIIQPGPVDSQAGNTAMTAAARGPTRASSSHCLVHGKSTRRWHVFAEIGRIGAAIRAVPDIGRAFVNSNIPGGVLGKHRLNWIAQNIHVELLCSTD